MIVFLTVIYLILLYVLIKLGKAPDSAATWLTVIPYILVLLIFFFVPMQWGAPAGDLRIMAYSVTITPNVAGQVVEVPAQPNTPLKKGDVLFTIDPTQYQASYDAIRADLALAETRLLQTKALAEDEAGSVYDVQVQETNVAKLSALLDNARWNLEQTTVRAPSDGIVTFVGLRPGARVSSMPVASSMAFIDTSEVILAAQVLQNFSRYIESGQPAEVTFKSRPGEVYSAKVSYILPVTAQGQMMVSGTAARPVSGAPGPFFVRLELDDPELIAGLVTGSVGTSAIYTSKATAAHLIRKVMIRLTSIINYIDPS